MKKNIRSLVTVDGNTGEVVDQHFVMSINYGTEPSYSKIYHDQIFLLESLSHTDLIVLKYFLDGSGAIKDKPEIIVNSYVRNTLANAAGCTPHNIDYCFRKLISRGIIARVGRGAYIANPYLFGRWNWKSVTALRQKYDRIRSQNEKAPTD